MNQVNIIGNIGTEPEVKVMPAGTKLAKFSVAINGYSKDPEKKPATTWVAIEMWDPVTEWLLKCRDKAALKGRKIRITGSLAMNSYTAIYGHQQVRVHKLFVKGQTFELLSGWEASKEAAPEQVPPTDLPEAIPEEQVPPIDPPEAMPEPEPPAELPVPKGRKRT